MHILQELYPHNMKQNTNDHSSHIGTILTLVMQCCQICYHNVSTTSSNLKHCFGGKNRQFSYWSNPHLQIIDICKENILLKSIFVNCFEGWVDVFLEWKILITSFTYLLILVYHTCWFHHSSFTYLLILVYHTCWFHYYLMESKRQEREV